MGLRFIIDEEKARANETYNSMPDEAHKVFKHLVENREFEDYQTIDLSNEEIYKYIAQEIFLKSRIKICPLDTVEALARMRIGLDHLCRNGFLAVYDRMRFVIPRTEIIKYHNEEFEKFKKEYESKSVVDKIEEFGL